MGWRRSAYERLRLLRSHLVEESNMSVLLAYYLIGVNAVGFIAALICCAYLARLETASGGSARSGEGSAIVDAVLGLLAVCGGGLGIALAFIGFYRAANKATMLTRVIVACMLMIDAVVALVLSGACAYGVGLECVGVFRPAMVAVLVLGDCEYSELSCLCCG